MEWHSMYMGTSLLPLPFSEEKIFKFLRACPSRNSYIRHVSVCFKKLPRFSV